MTEEELKEAQKYWRISIHFFWWQFMVYGNWKRRVLYTGRKIRFSVEDWHPFSPKKLIDYE